MSKQQASVDAACDEMALAGTLRDAADSFPPSERTAILRSSFLSKVAVRRLQAAPAPIKSESRKRATGRLVPAFYGVAIALAAIAVITMSLSFASVRAMPGSPLYSVKRTVERVQLSLLGRTEKVNALLKQANKRMGELGYATSRGMDSWLYSLASDAEEDIAEAKHEASSLGKTEAGRAVIEAGDIVIEHEKAVRQSVQSLPVRERESVQRWLDREVQERENEQNNGLTGPGGMEETAPAVAPGAREPEHPAEADARPANHEQSVSETALEQPRIEPVEAELTSEVKAPAREITTRSGDTHTRSDEIDTGARGDAPEAPSRSTSETERAD